MGIQIDLAPHIQTSEILRFLAEYYRHLWMDLRISQVSPEEDSRFAEWLHPTATRIQIKCSSEDVKERLQLGTQIRQIWNSHEGDVDRVFTITKVQTNGVFGTSPDLPQRAWMAFPKRGEIEFTDDGWCRVEGTRKLAEYVWVEGKGGETCRNAS